MKTTIRCAATALCSLAVSVLPLEALTYSVDSAGITAFSDDIFAPPGALVLPGVGGPGIEVNAFSSFYTSDSQTILFSVNRGSVGAPGTAVNGESTAFGGPPIGDEAADVYASTIGSGFNTQVWDGDGVVAFPGTPGAPSPPLGLAEGGVDNLDGLDFAGFPTPPVFSVDFATAFGAYGGAVTAADILAPSVGPYSAPVPPVYAPAAILGLVFGDDIDALVYIEDGVAGPTAFDGILFSLAAGSPTLGFLGATGADILFTSPGGAPAIFAPGAAIGLLPTDELDALTIVPEPRVYALLAGVAVLALAVLRRRR